MFPSLLATTDAFQFPLVTSIGTLYQNVTDNTEDTLRFIGNGNAPSTSSLNIQYSVGGAGPWTIALQDVYTLNGIPLADDPVLYAAPYYKNNYFRYRWENVTLGYVGPWTTFAGPTTKERWDTSTYPIAPTSIDDAVVYNLGPGLGYGVDVTLTHSLANSANYSYMGIYVEATALIFNGAIYFNQTVGAYFVGWGSSVGAQQIYRIVFGLGGNTAISVVSAQARYYVLGNPPPGIIGAPANL